MKRIVILTLLVGIGSSLSLAVAARQRGPEDPSAPKVVEVDKLKDNLFLLKGGGGNTAVFVTTTGVVVVDTKNPGWGTPLLAKIKTLTDKPVTMIINTHTHGDHVSGNVEFPATVDVVTHENTRTLMNEMRASSTNVAAGTTPQQVFKMNSGRNLPKRTFKDRMSIGAGADRIDLYYFGAAHTNGDAFVVFPALRVMHAGDAFSNKDLPNIDRNNGGSAVAYPQTIAKAAAIQGVDMVIQGHGSTALPFSDLKEYADFNADFMAWAGRQMKSGRPVDQAAAEYKHPEKYKGYGVPQPVRIRFNTQAYYDELGAGGR